MKRNTASGNLCARNTGHTITSHGQTAKKKIMVLYDDTVDDKRESPVRIRIYDADCFGTAYDDVAEFRNEFITLTGTPKDRIVCAAEWLRTAIASGGCDIGRRV